MRNMSWSWIVKTEHGMGCIFHVFIRFLKHLRPLVDLLARCWVAKIFLQSAIVKISSWQTTLMLFAYEYHVPFLNPNVAAVLGTAAEFILPALLVLGLGGRLMILIFFIYNAIAMGSYPFLWTDAGSVGLSQHISWALLLALLIVNGPGNWSVDAWLHKRHIRRLHQLAEKHLSSMGEKT